MGKMHLFTSEQKFIFDKVKTSEYLRANFYFTGGTALSYFYLQHRFSEDLDFFSEKKFDQEAVLQEVESWIDDKKFSFVRQIKEVVSIYNLHFANNEKIKIDFGYYPYKRVEVGKSYEGFRIDSLLDIAINKLASINQRSQVKDFVDLYFLLDKHTIWDLLEGVRIKFRMKLEPWILASDMVYMVDQFTFLPKMIKPLAVDELKNFFRQKAKEIGGKVIK